MLSPQSPPPSGRGEGLHCANNVVTSEEELLVAAVVFSQLNDGPIQKGIATGHVQVPNTSNALAERLAKYVHISYDDKFTICSNVKFDSNTHSLKNGCIATGCPYPHSFNEQEMDGSITLCHETFPIQVIHPATPDLPGVYSPFLVPINWCYETALIKFIVEQRKGDQNTDIVVQYYQQVGFRMCISHTFLGRCQRQSRCTFVHIDWSKLPVVTKTILCQCPYADNAGCPYAHRERDLRPPPSFYPRDREGTEISVVVDGCSYKLTSSQHFCTAGSKGNATKLCQSKQCVMWNKCMFIHPVESWYVGNHLTYLRPVWSAALSQATHTIDDLPAFDGKRACIENDPNLKFYPRNWCAVHMRHLLNSVQGVHTEMCSSKLCPFTHIKKEWWSLPYHACQPLKCLSNCKLAAYPQEWCIHQLKYMFGMNKKGCLHKTCKFMHIDTYGNRRGQNAALDVCQAGERELTEFLAPLSFGRLPTDGMELRMDEDLKALVTEESLGQFPRYKDIISDMLQRDRWSILGEKPNRCFYYPAVTTSGKEKGKQPGLLGRGASASVFLGLLESHSMLPVAVKVWDKVIRFEDGKPGPSVADVVAWEGYLQEKAVLQKLETECLYICNYEIESIKPGKNDPRPILKKRPAIVMRLRERTLADVVSGWKDRLPHLTESEVTRFPFLHIKAVRRVISDVMRTLHSMTSSFPLLFHLDIKPGNVCFNRKLQVTLADFGSSKYSSWDGNWKVYTPPEVLKKDHAHVNSDVYSVGLVLYYALTFEFPDISPHHFQADLTQGSHWEQLLAIHPSSVDKKSYGHKAYGAADLIRRMTEIQPNDRPNSSEVMSHPFWWTDSDCISFISNIDSIFELYPSECDSLKKQYDLIVGGNWLNTMLLPKYPKLYEVYTKGNPTINLASHEGWHFGRMIRNFQQHIYGLASPCPLLAEYPSLVCSLYSVCLENPGLREHHALKAQLRPVWWPSVDEI